MNSNGHGSLQIDLHSERDLPSCRQILKSAARTGLSFMFGLVFFSAMAVAVSNDIICIGCHTTRGLSTKLPGGELVSLAVDIESFRKSVHGQLSCADCHTSIHSYPHPLLQAHDHRDFQIDVCLNCNNCHPQQYLQSMDSIHTRARKAGKRDAAICIDCHGSHGINRTNQSRLGISTNCGTCHRAVYAEYLTSAHGKAMLEISNPDVPACTDCHGAHSQEDPNTIAFRLKSPRICARCHGNAAMMRKYNLSHKVFDSYVADFHGSTVVLFENQNPSRQANQAVCTDCHGVHGIQRTSSTNSSVVKENLLVTCRRCHRDATTDFPDSWVGHFAPSRTRFPLVYYVNLFYWIIIPVTVGGMLVFVIIDVVGRILRRRKFRVEQWKNSSVSGENNHCSNADLKIPKRFTLSQRIEHALLAVAFTMLAFTGFVHMLAEYPPANRLIHWIGGLETMRLHHRAAAILFVLLGVYHLILLIYKAMISREKMTMMPRGEDFRNAMHFLRYNLMQTEAPPLMPRYTFYEKLEYCSLLWGSVIMVLTGLLLLNPLVTAKYLPSQFIPAAKAAHIGEAILAVLAVAVWHLYHVHVRTFNKSMFTGRLTIRQMAEEHGHEYKRLIEGETPPIADCCEMRRRLPLFIAFAGIIAALGVGGIYWAATVEAAPVLAPPSRPGSIVQRPGTVDASSKTKAIMPAPFIPHSIDEGSQCRECHAIGMNNAVPENHQGRPAKSCQICHKSQVKPKIMAIKGSTDSRRPGSIPHPIQEDIYRNCSACHAAEGGRPYPSTHKTYAADSCILCHLAASGTLR